MIETMFSIPFHMKKIIPFLTVLTLTLAACESTQTEAEKFMEDAKNSYNNVVEETEKLVEKAGEAKDKTVETINDIKDAAKEVKEASEALDKVTD